MARSPRQIAGRLIVVAMRGADSEAAEELADHVGAPLLRRGGPMGSVADLLADACRAATGDASSVFCDAIGPGLAAGHSGGGGVPRPARSPHDGAERDLPPGERTPSGHASASKADARALAGGAGEGAVALVLDADGLSLHGDGMELRGDLTRMLPRLKRGRLQQELLVKAARIKGFEGSPTAVDATAGLGEDALLLAAAGFRVQLYESDPVIAALLRDALRRAAAEPELAIYIERMTLIEGDSIAALPRLPFAPDVVYLDPMFPERSKSAAVKKKFQLLHRLEQPCAEQEALVEAALAAHPRKVVIKRPRKGEYLAGIKPSHSIAGKTVRYDCLVPPRS